MSKKSVDVGPRFLFWGRVCIFVGGSKLTADILQHKIFFCQVNYIAVI